MQDKAGDKWELGVQRYLGDAHEEGTFLAFPEYTLHTLPIKILIIPLSSVSQRCIFRLTCSHPELAEVHVLTSAYVKIFRTVTRNAVNKSVWRKKDYSWLPLNKHAMNIWSSSLRIRAHLSWRTGKHLHVLHVLRTYSTCSCPGQQDTTTYAALVLIHQIPGCYFSLTPWPKRVDNLHHSWWGQLL